MNERMIFEAALDRASPTERVAYLDEACAGDAELRRRVEDLLAAHAEPGSFLESPADLGDATAQLGAADSADRPVSSPIIEGPGTRIGPYKLLQKIGEGGMGVVYMAEQEHVIRRRVALKIIKPGMDTDQVIARFEAERQALALMDHQNIAKVLDAGTTESGRPYFVMELVRGVPITEYCDQNRLTPRERLELFVPVCQAIQHAHQKGIIHRDVKPSNVLVTLHDGRPVPKIIDFGVAKAIDQRLTERTLFTQFGAIIGTWEYMSPEQAELSGLDVDTRSDIYSLGVLLYELLTGSTPLERAKLREAAYSEILRKIRDEEPPKPSTRLSESRDTLPAISAQRKTEPAKLARLVRGELDWIVMKALEKDRTRRYETANGLARDIERYLGGDPVEAGPPSAGYRLRKFARKYRTPLRLMTAFGLLLIIAAAMSTWQAIRATRAERAARQERDRAVEAESEAKAVIDFLRNDLLAQASSLEQSRMWPGASPDPDVKVRTLLDRAAERVGAKLSRQPLVEAIIRETIGTTYLFLGRFGPAEQHLERALNLHRHEQGEAAPETMTAMSGLQWLYLLQGKMNEAVTLGTKTLELCRKAQGEEHSDTLEAMIALGYTYTVHGDYREAEPLLTKGLEVSRRAHGENEEVTLGAMERLSDLYLCRGELAETEWLLTRSLEAIRKGRGEEHLFTLDTMCRLGELYLAQGKYAQAETLLARAVEASRRLLGLEHYLTLWGSRALGRSCQFQGEQGRAESLLTKSLEVSRRLWDEECAYTQLAVHDLVSFYMARERYAQAKPLIGRWLEVNHGESGGERLFWPWAMSYLSWFLANSPESSGDRDPARAVGLAQKAVASTPQDGFFWHTLGVAHFRAGDWKAAVTELEKSMPLPRNPWAGRVDCTDRLFLAMAHCQLGHRDEARHWYDQAIEWMETRKRRDPELLRFRAEAAALLGVKERPEPKSK
jgi:serine/threonine protein kinase/tetratricopeptide (TPR) repeat protein